MSKNDAFKGLQFYAELPSHYGSKSSTRRKGFVFTRQGIRKLIHNGKATGEPFRLTCVAVDFKSRRYDSNAQGSVMDAACVVQDGNPVLLTYSSVSTDYLNMRCLRIGRDVAFQLHPELKGYLQGLHDAEQAANKRVAK